MQKSLLRMNPYFQYFIIIALSYYPLKILYKRVILSHLISLLSLSCSIIKLRCSAREYHGSPSPRSTAISKSIITPSWGFLNHTIYGALKLAYINLHSDRSKRDRVLRHPKAQSPPPYPAGPINATVLRVGWVHVTSAISPLPVRGCTLPS